HLERECLYLHAPSNLYRYWLEDNYGDLLQETLSAISGKSMTLCFLKLDEEPKSDTKSTTEVVSEARGGKLPSSSEKKSGLNPMFTFNHFIVGPSNQYAHAGCWAVAQSPGRSYNPLFIYGATGL